MFNDFFIATTALSSFNNAALVAPFFFAVALVSLPLFAVIYLCGDYFISKFGWNGRKIDDLVSFWSSISLMLWLLLFGGNYAVIRDGISLLPTLLSFVLFVLMIIITRKSILLGYSEKMRGVFIPLLVLLAAVSAPDTLWGILLQISAIVCGLIIGLKTHKNISLMPWNVLILVLLVGLVLMQPEFFRFGQLGNLTIFHDFSIVFAGFCAITALVTRYVHARARIYQSAYIKLKWLCRIVSFLALVLFVSTESVPVFIGLVAAMGMTIALSVYHMKNIPDDLYKIAFSLLLMSVGIIIICPVLTAIGIIYLVAERKKTKMRDFVALL